MSVTKKVGLVLEGGSMSGMEAAGEVFVIRPSAPIKLKTIERDPEKLQKVYELGIRDGTKIINTLDAYLKD